MAFINDPPAQKISFWQKRKRKRPGIIVTNSQTGIGRLSDYDNSRSRLGGYDADAAENGPMRNALRVMRGFQQPMTGVPIETYRGLAKKAVAQGLTVSPLGDYGDASSPATSASDYLRAFSDFTNQALNTYGSISQNLRNVRQPAREPAPAPTPVQRVNRFSRNNSGLLLGVAGALAAVLIVPKLMKR